MISIDRIPTSVRSSLFYPHILGEDVFCWTTMDSWQTNDHMHIENGPFHPLFGVYCTYDLYYTKLRLLSLELSSSQQIDFPIFFYLIIERREK
jgi:hypothetical protein